VTSALLGLEQFLGVCGSDEAGEALRFRLGARAAEPGELVVAAPVVVIGPGVRGLSFLEQALVDEAGERVVQRARGEADVAVRALADVSNDGVPVERAVGEGEQDLERLRCHVSRYTAGRHIGQDGPIRPLDMPEPFRRGTGAANAYQLK
jgi:hypothetical protein